MIAFLKGTIATIEENKIVLETNQAGVNIFMTSRDIGNLSVNGKEVKIHTHFQVREDALSLYGFLSKDDLRVFQLILNVNGVGPKAALGILSTLSANELRFAVLAGDAKAISKAPGIGNKTAQKLILELKDRFDLEETFESASQISESVPQNIGASVQVNEAVEALTALGYPAADALKAVHLVTNASELSTEELLKAALKKMMF